MQNKTPSRISGIYQIECTVTGKKYIGSAVDIKRRWRTHRTTLNTKTHHNQKLMRAYGKYGKEAFVYSILEQCLPDELESRELYYITTLRPFYNSLSVHNPTKRMLQHSPETRAQLSQSNLNRWSIRKAEGTDHHSPETREKMSQSARKRTFSEETRKKMSESAKRRGAPVISVESRQRGAEKQRGKTVSLETRQKLQQSLTGRTLTSQHRENISQGLKRR